MSTESPLVEIIIKAACTPCFFIELRNLLRLQQSYRLTLVQEADEKATAACPLVVPNPHMTVALEFRCVPYVEQAARRCNIASQRGRCTPLKSTKNINFGYLFHVAPVLKRAPRLRFTKTILSWVLKAPFQRYHIKNQGCNSFRVWPFHSI